MNGAVVVLINAKGGSGATTLGLEAARSIRRDAQTVAIVDADLTGRRTLAVMCDTVRQFDGARTLGVFSVVSTAGMTAVEMTDSLDNAFALRVDDVDALVDKLVAQHDVVIVDAPAPFAAAVRPFVSRASRFVIVLEPNLLGTAAARTMIGDLTKFGIPLARVWIVSNLRGGRAEIAPRELERALGGTSIAEVPFKTDRNWQRTIDAMGKKLVSATPETALGALRPSSFVAASGAPTSESKNGAVTTLDIKPARPQNERRNRLKAEVHEQITKRIDVVAASRAHTDAQKIAELRAQIQELTGQLLSERSDIETVEERAELQQEIIDELLGLGPLEDLMRDAAVSEIMVNGPATIYVERGGKISLSDRRFNDERHLRTIIERIIAPLGRRIDESSPMVDARLPDGSRVNAIIEPLALNGSTMTIRRFGTRRLTMDDLIRLNSLPVEATNLLRAMVESRLNIVVSGGTGSGKTTFLNILSNYIPPGDRIITI
ncbi:MAG: ATPase, T2SS/T4P/T4SS family, partial [Vulcanimicrobiaceae bacterium]